MLFYSKRYLWVFLSLSSDDGGVGLTFTFPETDSRNLPNGSEDKEKSKVSFLSLWGSEE